MNVVISLKILVVDDSMSARIMLIEAVPESVKKYATFVEAKNGTEGIEFFKREQPDITFLDLTMPDINGEDVLREIKKISPNAQVVIVTADRQKSTKETLLNIGAQQVLNKPVDSDKIREIFYKLAI